MPPPTNPSGKRFLYHASAIGVAAVLEAPKPLRESWASSALPIIGGKATSSASKVNQGVFSFDSASTTVTGERNSNGQVVSEARTTVMGFNLLNGSLKADTVDVSLAFTYDWNSEKLSGVTVTKQTYKGLVIDAVSYDEVLLEGDLAEVAGKDHNKFRRSDLPDRRPNQYHIRGRKVHTTLARDGQNPPRLKFDNAGRQFGYVDASFGRVYFGAWTQEQDWQFVTALRIVLDSPQAKGEIVIADPFENGEFYP